VYKHHIPNCIASKLKAKGTFSHSWHIDLLCTEHTVLTKVAFFRKFITILHFRTLY